MRSDIFEILDDFFSEFPVLVAGAPQASEVDQIESFAGFQLPLEYRMFVERYGAAIVGPHSVYGVGASEAMGKYEASVIAVTERFRAEGWPGTEDTLVISMDHAGNAITLDARGIVHRFDHDDGSTDELASSFGMFIEKLLAR
ncbi:MAG TPA: SMI1/KNR4 family protein [Allosphingosinicella sp.]